MIPAGIGRNIARGLVGAPFTAAGSAWRSMGATLGTGARTAIAGAAIGGAYGAFSDNTSVLGGAMIGTGLGLGGRYARAGYRGAARYLRGNSPVSYRGLGLNIGSMIARRFRGDIFRPRVLANRGFNRITSSLKGWGAGAVPAV